MLHNSTTRNQQGITLFESLITVLIISTAFISLTRLQLGMWKTTQETQLIETANSLAFSKINEISQLIASTATSPDNGSASETIHNISFTTSWNTQETKTGAYNIEVKVGWKSKSVIIKSVKYSLDNSIKSLLLTTKQE